MKTYYIAFGQNHTHKLNGVILDNNCFIEIRAKNNSIAMDYAFSTFGQKWRMIYSMGHFDKSYYPRGCVLKVVA